MLSRMKQLVAEYSSGVRLGNELGRAKPIKYNCRNLSMPVQPAPWAAASRSAARTLIALKNRFQLLNFMEELVTPTSNSS